MLCKRCNTRLANKGKYCKRCRTVSVTVVSIVSILAFSVMSVLLWASGKHVGAVG